MYLLPHGEIQSDIFFISLDDRNLHITFAPANILNLEKNSIAEGIGYGTQ